MARPEFGPNRLLAEHGMNDDPMACSWVEPPREASTHQYISLHVHILDTSQRANFSASVLELDRMKPTRMKNKER